MPNGIIITVSFGDYEREHDPNPVWDGVFLNTPLLTFPCPLGRVEVMLQVIKME